MKLLIFYLIVINATGLFIMLLDKHNAIHSLRRIPERSLLLVALMGGSFGSLCGMYLFRHKTRHLKFSLGLPVIFVIQLIGIGLLIYMRNTRL